MGYGCTTCIGNSGPLPQHHHHFRAFSCNLYLMEEAMDCHSDGSSIGALRERAWQLMQPHYLKRLGGVVEAFGAARWLGRDAEDLGSIAVVAVAGRIATLLIEAERLILGRIHAASRVIPAGNLSDSDVDDLGEYVLTSGGDVIIVPTARIAARTGTAGIYRF
nr:hypothetical protein [Nitratireductor mangrovi]